MDKMETNIITHISIVVRDIVKTIENYTSFFNIKSPEIVDSEAYKIAFIRMGLINLEFIQPLNGDSIWKEHLECYGEGVHHIGFRIKNSEEYLEFLNSSGLKILQEVENDHGKNYYIDTKSTLGVILELSEIQSNKRKPST